MQTENLGIERVVTNVLANPNIRFLVLCGEDSEQAVGHLPGQSLVALAANGLDERSQIVGARGKRPVIKNISPGAIDHFRSNVEVIDLIGEARIDRILGIAGECASQNLGPSEAFGGVAAIKPICGRLPERMTPDPEGYFVIYVDAARRMLSLEHFRKDGVLNAVIEGKAAAELYLPAIEKGMVSRLDHAAYLGKELSRAEKCLEDGENYVQDAAPEMLAPSNRCDCSCPCSEEGS
jgi:tetrahydromethanopterin S-methyltransferase subunit A